MGKKSKNKAQKKKRISKHMLKSRDGTVVETADVEQGNEMNNVVKNSIETSSEWITPNAISNNAEAVSSARHVKEPEEATSYLTTWKAFKRNTDESTSVSNTVWKFNKNTQSWLIRHLYEVDKVPKGTFDLLLEYLQGLQGDKTQLRIVSEASRRARRYKDYVVYQQADFSSSEPNDNDCDKDEHIASTNTQSDTVTIESTTVIPKEDSEREQDEVRWKQLSDHDKRKEYKRARKVLDVVKIGCRE
jgi:hypothetical protein